MISLGRWMCKKIWDGDCRDDFPAVFSFTIRSWYIIDGYCLNIMKKLMDKYNTQISKNNYAKIKGQDMTPEEMIGFLEEGALFRKFRNILETAYPGEDLPYKLARGLSEITGVAYSNVLRKVNNWLKKDCGPKSREDLFQICFVLGLGEEDSSRLLASSSESGIHYRDPKELIYAFALQTDQDYDTAVRLTKELEPIY